MKPIWLAVLALCFPLLAAGQQDNVVRLDGISIQGNSEEPKVVLITPWREPPGTGRLYDGATSFREQWLYSLDPQRLAHEVQLLEYYQRKTDSSSQPLSQPK